MTPYLTWLGLLIGVTLLNTSLTLLVHERFTKLQLNGALQGETVQGSRLHGWLATLVLLLGVSEVAMGCLALCSFPYGEFVQAHKTRVMWFLLILLLLAIIHGSMSIYATEEFYALRATREIDTDQSELSGSFADSWMGVAMVTLIGYAVGGTWWLSRFRVGRASGPSKKSKT